MPLSDKGLPPLYYKNAEPGTSPLVTLDRATQERTSVRTTIFFFPFDLFGSGGTAAGVELLADALREMLADNRRERVPSRALAYQPHVRLQEFAFETLEDYQGWRAQARRLVRRAWERGDFVLWITGNHLGVLPLYEELAARADGTLIVQLDAHLDIYHFSDCTQELSHGNFLRHCPEPLPPILNLGHRDLLLPADQVTRYYRQALSITDLVRDPQGVQTWLRRQAQTAPHVFIDLDCDVLDPAVFPAAAQPVPFGLSAAELLALLDAAWTPQVLGLALSEFAPARDQRDQGLALLVWLLEYLLLRRYETASAAADPDGTPQREN
jgi:agmatinase